MDDQTALMQRIKDAWGLKIALACASSSVPPAFIAALVANESGGDPNAVRFEPTVAGNLIAAVCGKKPAFAVAGCRRPLDAQELQTYLAVTSRTDGIGIVAAAAVRLGDLASSFGLTQIMGFHVLMWNGILTQLRGEGPGKPGNPQGQLEFTVKLLAWFAERYNLDARMIPGEAEGFFRCWNSGRPDGKTFDSAYVPEGLERMRIYQQLVDADTAAISAAGPAQQ